MRCDDVRELRIDRLRGRLSPDRARELDDHLAECPACRAELEEEKRLDHVLDRLPGLPVPEGFALRVLSRTVGRIWRMRLVRWGAAAAAVLLVAILASTAGDGLSSEEREIVEHLDLLENLHVVETADLVDEPSAVDDIDLAAELSEELY